MTNKYYASTRWCAISLDIDASRSLASLRGIACKPMKTIKLIGKLCLLMFFAVVTGSASAQTTITSFNRNGQLTWTNAPGTNGFSVEWASTLTGPWSSSWQGLDSVVTTATQTTVSVPMFYRVRTGFATASLRGPWILANGTNNYSYALFDGAGTVTELGLFYPGSPCGTYTVQSNGAMTLSLFFLHDGSLTFQGTFASGQQIVINPVTNNIQMFQVSNSSACQGHWSGTLIETGGTTTTVSFDVDATGLISNCTGLPAYVFGRMLSDPGNRVAAFFRNGASADNPYNQVQVSGTLSNNNMNGVFYLDLGQAVNTIAGTATLQRQ